MDINDLRIIATVLSFVMFISIVVWAYSGKRKRAFDEAAALPIDDEDQTASNGRTAGQQHN